MENRLHELAALCATQMITSDLIASLDALMASYGSSHQTPKVQGVSSAWQIISTSLMFWDNLSAILCFSTVDETKVQALIVMEQRIKSNWANQSSDVRQMVKKYLCDESQKYYHSLPMSPARLAFFHKVNSAMVEILKYQWNGEWSSFLFDLCEAMLNNPNYAENYLDLLKLIFEEIFRDQQKLTSYELEGLRKLVDEKYGVIQRVFDVYLDPSGPAAVIHNCLMTIEAFLQWISPSYIYFGLAIEKIILNLQSPRQRQQALICLEEIFKYPKDEPDLKMFKKKRKIFLQAFNQLALNTDPDEAVTQKLLNLATMLALQERKVASVSPLPQDEAFVIESLQIWSKAFELLQGIESTQPFADLILYVCGHAEVEDWESIIRQFIEVTPCPVNCSLYKEEKIIKSQNWFEQDLEYLSQFEKALQHYCSQKVKYINLLINQMVHHKSKNIADLRYICKISWNLYLYVGILNEHRVAEIILDFCFPLFNWIDEILTAINIRKKSQKLEIKLLKALKASVVLLICHPKFLPQPRAIQKYSPYLSSQFNEDTVLVKHVSSCLIACFSKMHPKDRLYLNEQFWNLTSKQISRFQLHLHFLEEITRVQLKDPDILKFALVIIDGWKQFLVSRDSPVIDSQTVFDQFMSHYLREGAELASLLSVALPLLVGGYLQQLQSSLMELRVIMNTCKQILCKSKQNGLINTAKEFASKYFNLQLILFGNITVQTFQKRAAKILEQAIFVYHTALFILEAAGNKSNSSTEEIVQQCLTLIGCVIAKLSGWNFEPNKKKQLIFDALNRIQQIGYDVDTPGYAVYLSSVITSSCFDSLKPQMSQKLALKIFELAVRPNQQLNSHAVKIMKELISKSTDEASSVCGFIQSHLYDFTLSTFRLLVDQKPSSALAADYIEVMHLSIMEVRRLNWTLVPEQPTSNINQVHLMLCELLEEELLIKGAFLAHLTEMLKHIWVSSDSRVFREGLGDFLVVLHRGF